MYDGGGWFGWLGYDGGASTYVSFEQVNIVVQVLFVMFFFVC